MFRILIFAVAAFFLYKFFVGDKKKKMQNKRQEQENLTHSGEMVKDPVCGTYVCSDSDIRVKDAQGDVYNFCSYECRDKFLESSSEYKKPLSEDN